MKHCKLSFYIAAAAALAVSISPVSAAENESDLIVSIESVTEVGTDDTSANNSERDGASGNHTNESESSTTSGALSEYDSASSSLSDSLEHDETSTSPSGSFEHDGTSGSLTDSNSASAAALQGICEIASAANSDFILDVKHCTVQDTDTKTLQLYRALDVNQQKFYLEALPNGGFRLSVLHTGDAVTVSPDGRSVQMAAVDHSENAVADEAQVWQLEDAGDGTFYLSSGDAYLTLADGEPYSGASVALSEYSGNDSQKWLLNHTWVSAEAAADTDLVNPYGADGEFRDFRIAMKFGTKYEFLRSAELAQHITESEDHRLVLDPDFLSSYVEKLVQKYDTQGKPRRFLTSHNTEITLYNGDFGWKLDAEATKAALQEALGGTSLVPVEPVWSHKGVDFGEINDIGDSYVEIDLANQKVWLYKDGEQLLETDCVSGTFGTDRQTPGGVYSIFYMQSPDVLNGADYSSYVEYWMAFNGNIGMHDANWRSEFGGDIYRSNGSHGCVNLPTDAAKQIYETVSYGYPVVCYQ